MPDCLGAKNDPPDTDYIISLTGPSSENPFRPGGPRPNPSEDYLSLLADMLQGMHPRNSAEPAAAPAGEDPRRADSSGVQQQMRYQGVTTELQRPEAQVAAEDPEHGRTPRPQGGIQQRPRAGSGERSTPTSLAEGAEHGDQTDNQHNAANQADSNAPEGQ